jgi:hypothetical protein
LIYKEEFRSLGIPVDSRITNTAFKEIINKDSLCNKMQTTK